MKLLWTKAELQSNRGCYEETQIEELWNGGRGETVTLVEILESSVNIRDKRWFLYHKAGMTLDQKKALALIAAKVVLPIYEEKYPDYRRVRNCIEATEKFYRGEVSRDELRTAADTAAAAADAAYAAYAAYAAADADAAAAAYAAYAAYAAAAAADADADADAAAAAADADAAAADADAADADARKNTTYSQRLQAAFIDFVNSESLQPA